MLRSKLSESLSLALVSTGYEQATAMRCQRPQRYGHAPPFNSPKATAIARNEHDHTHPV
jgi:hypothetical protein